MSIQYDQISPECLKLIRTKDFLKTDEPYAIPTELQPRVWVPDLHIQGSFIKFLRFLKNSRCKKKRDSSDDFAKQRAQAAQKRFFGS